MPLLITAPIKTPIEATILKEYRMLLYAVILILVMLATNSPALQDLFHTLFHGKKKKEDAGK